jgi:hypothetical protein
LSDDNKSNYRREGSTPLPTLLQLLMDLLDRARLHLRLRARAPGNRPLVVDSEEQSIRPLANRAFARLAIPHRGGIRIGPPPHWDPRSLQNTKDPPQAIPKSYHSGGISHASQSLTSPLLPPFGAPAAARCVRMVDPRREGALQRPAVASPSKDRRFRTELVGDRVGVCGPWSRASRRVQSSRTKLDWSRLAQSG